VNTTRVPYSKDSKPARGDYWRQSSGKLYCETLLPKEARVEFVGGPGKEFWVNGRNYPTRIREVDLVSEPGVGRIEVSPSAPRALDVFLHVLSPTSDGDRTPRPKAAVIPATDATALSIEDTVLVLPADAKPSPRITYEIGGSGLTRHIITGLPAGKSCRVQRGARTVHQGKSSPQGVLIFTSRERGSFRVSS
jgi:hypothetical protein